MIKLHDDDDDDEDEKWNSSATKEMLMKRLKFKCQKIY